MPASGSVAVLDRPTAPEPHAPLPRLPLDAWSPVPPVPDASDLDAAFDELLGAAPRGRRQPVVTVSSRRGVAAVVAAGGVLTLVTAGVPAGSFTGGVAAMFAPAAESTPAVGVQVTLPPAVPALPATALPGTALPGTALPGTERRLDVADLVAGVRSAQATVTEQVAAAQQQTADRATAEAAADKAASDEKAADEKAAGDCGLDEKGLGAVKSYVRTAAELIGCRFGEPTMYGIGGRGGVSDHPGGRAVDFMVDRATGDRLAQCVLANKKALGVTYVIWRQRINLGSGWQAMEDRGSTTANHYDHVHVSFGNGGGSETLQGC